MSTWSEDRDRVAKIADTFPDGVIADKVRGGGINRTTDLWTLQCSLIDLRHWKGDEQVKRALIEMREAYHRAWALMNDRLRGES